MKKSTLGQMPTYTKEITIPKKTPDKQWVQPIIRYYAPFGSGPPNGWEENLLSPPKLTLNGVEMDDMGLIFAGAPSGTEIPAQAYWKGPQDGGFDQHAQLYWSAIDLKDGEEQKLMVSGSFEQVGYYSLTLYFWSSSDITSQISYQDKDMVASPEGSNPYHVGNPSVFAYNTPSKTNLKNKRQIPVGEFKMPSLSGLKFEPIPKEGISSNKVFLFRPDVQSSTTRSLEDIAPDGCSVAYLVTETVSNPSNPPAYQDFDFLMLRIKVPTTFVHNDNPDKVFGKYQCRYLSVNSNILKSNSPGILDFWTVDSTMLNDYMDEDGYAYVFFASDKYVKEQADLQNTQPRIPPVIEWGQYKGYLLGFPTYSMIIRYRNPSDDWEGNPGNCACYLTTADSRPINFRELGEWTPEMYGASESNFKAGKIGPVHKNRKWPTVKSDIMV